MLIFKQHIGQAVKQVIRTALLCTTFTLVSAAQAQLPLSPYWSTPDAFGDAVTTGVNPHIASSETAWISVFSSHVAGNPDYEILFTRSTDGATWTSPELLNTDWETDTGEDTKPRIEDGDNGVWICVWEHSGSIHTAKSIDNGLTWSTPVSIGTGTAPSIAFVGLSQWLLAYGPGMNYLRSADEGATWDAPVDLPAVIKKGSCGNTSPCATEYLSNPVIAGSSRSGIAILGFDVYSVSLPGGYAGGASTSYGTGGFRSDDKGLTFPDARDRYPYYTYNYMEGNTAVKVTGLEDYFIAFGRRFYKRLNKYEFIEGVSHPNTAVSTSTRLAVSDLGHWMGLSINTYTGISGTTTGLIATLSTDFGTTWEPIHTIETTTATVFGDIVTAELESSPAGQFITVYQVTDANGNSTIWHSCLDRFIADTDNDTILDEVDQCPNTPEGDIIDANGCSILQNCPCEGPREGGLYKNKKGQKKCLKQQAKLLVKDGRITKKERKVLLKQYKGIECPPVSK